MDTLKLSEIIGQEIKDLRFHYISENEYGLQLFYSYIKLANDIIIGIPKFNDSNDYLQLTEESLDYFKKRFDTGELVNEKTKSYFVGQKIVDFYFSYYNIEVDPEYSSFMKLTNGYYLSENNSGPVGLTDIDLIIIDENQFIKRTNELKKIEVDVHSFINTKNTSVNI